MMSLMGKMVCGKPEGEKKGIEEVMAVVNLNNNDGTQPGKVGDGCPLTSAHGAAFSFPHVWDLYTFWYCAPLCARGWQGVCIMYLRRAAPCVHMRMDAGLWTHSGGVPKGAHASAAHRTT